MRKKGIHFLCDLDGSPYALNDTIFLMGCQVEKLIQALNFQIIRILVEPQSHEEKITGAVFFYSLHNGYVSVYAYPEYQFCTFDFFSFSIEFDLELIVEKIKEYLNPTNLSYRIIQRNFQEKISDNHKRLFQSRMLSSWNMKTQI